MVSQTILLLVEDDDAHAILISRMIEKTGVANKIYRVDDGEEALDYIFHRGNYAAKESSPRPDLVFLDLRLLKLDGHEVLIAIKQSEKLKSIPVVVLSTSENESDISKAYRNQANSYLVKPMGFGEFSELIRELGSYWLVRNRRLVNG